jgi:SH3-like domain-containing protein
MLARLLLGACLLLGSVIGLAPAPVLAQSGTLQAPAHKPAEAARANPAAQPAATPRPTARQATPPEHATPVVRPHGSVRPAKPPAERQPRLPLPLPPPAPNAGPAVPPSATAPAAPAPTKPEEAKPAGTGLPLPRFAALRSDDVNLRAGPGFRYPIEWVYKRRDLPVEIEREFEVWRLVAAPDGIRGWVHQATLTGLRTFMVQGADATLRAEPKDDAAPVAILKVGVIGRVRSCDAGTDWCRLQIGDYRGFLKRSQFWGALPDEVIAP